MGLHRRRLRRRRRCGRYARSFGGPERRRCDSYCGGSWGWQSAHICVRRRQHVPPNARGHRQRLDQYRRKASFRGYERRRLDGGGRDAVGGYPHPCGQWHGPRLHRPCVRVAATATTATTATPSATATATPFATLAASQSTAVAQHAAAAAAAPHRRGVRVAGRPSLRRGDTRL